MPKKLSYKWLSSVIATLEFTDLKNLRNQPTSIVLEIIVQRGEMTPPSSK